MYAEATLDEKQASLNASTVHAIEFYGAVPKYLVPDNLKTGVTTNTRDSVVINASCQDLEDFYGTIAMPPPYRKPKGKATAERYVQTVQGKVIEALDERYFFRSLDEVNEPVMGIVAKLNASMPRGYGMSHGEMFELYDKPAMKPLESRGFASCDHAYCPSVPNNCHVVYDGHFYSAPCRLCGKRMVAKATRDTIRVCDESNRLVAEHKRCYIPTIRYVTKKEHMPAGHRFYEEVNTQGTEYYREWADGMGQDMRRLAEAILKSARHEEQMHRTCNSPVHLCTGISRTACEEAAAECVKRRQCRFSDFRQALGDLPGSRASDSQAGRLPDTGDTWGKDYCQ